MSGGTTGTTIRHHPSEATLVAQAAGSLWKAAALIAEAHLDRCAHGGFQWSSQHRDGGWCDGGNTAFGSGTTGEVSFARPAWGGTA